MVTLTITRADLARALSVLRVSCGWSQQELSAASGLSSALVSNAENIAALPPSRPSVQTLVESMGFSLGVLVRTRDFLRELDRDREGEEIRRANPAEFMRATPALALDANARCREEFADHFPGPRTTDWSHPRWGRPRRPA